MADCHSFEKNTLSITKEGFHGSLGLAMGMKRITIDLEAIKHLPAGLTSWPYRSSYWDPGSRDTSHTRAQS